MKRTQKARWFLCGILVIVLAAGLITPTPGALTGKTIEVYIGVNIYIDDVKLDPMDAKGNPVETFVYNGSTYLPVRAIGEAVGRNVRWDSKTSSVYLTGKTSASRSKKKSPSAAATLTQKFIEVYTGVNIYIDNVKLVPKDANGNTVETFIYNGTTYLPVRAIGEALGKAVQWESTVNSVYLGKHDREAFVAAAPLDEFSPSTITVDLSNPVMYQQLNLFLSYFSEVNLSVYPFDSSYYPQVQDVAFCHAYLRDRSLTENCNVYIDDYPFGLRMSEGNIKMVIEQLFDGSVDFSSLYQSSSYINGYYYYSISTDMFGAGFTLVDSITDLEEGSFEVQFHVYTGLYSEFPAYDYSDSTVYSTHPNNLPEPYLGQQFVAIPGSAVIKIYQGTDGSLSFRLCKYYLDYK